jgi:hydroxyethylthiazole kinase-like uncharacterized protein yjeF
MKTFAKSELENLYKPPTDSNGEDNGQVTIVGGSKLFHGAPLYAVKLASRIVDMVFFASPDPSVGEVANKMKSELLSFIWIPWDEVEHYIEKSDAVLIGPGFMRFSRESQIANHQSLSKDDKAAKETRDITKKLLSRFPNKKWVIDAGSLQVMDAEWIPEGAVITPNRKEFELLFQLEPEMKNIEAMAKKYNCVIVSKGPETFVCSPDESIEVKGGNAGLTKGGTGDVLAGLTVALLAKNDALLAACAASYIAKAAADELYKKVGPNYNADDLADKIPETLHSATSNR